MSAEEVVREICGWFLLVLFSSFFFFSLILFTGIFRAFCWGFSLGGKVEGTLKDREERMDGC